MNTKLTLTVDSSVIEHAKRYAESQNKSLSKIVEHYLRSITFEEQTNTTELKNTYCNFFKRFI
jgi:hypothetical protein